MDKESELLAADVVNKEADHGQLSPILNEVKEDLGGDTSGEEPGP